MTQASWTTSFFTPCQALEIRERPNPYYKRKKKQRQNYCVQLMNFMNLLHITELI